MPITSQREEPATTAATHAVGGGELDSNADAAVPQQESASTEVLTEPVQYSNAAT